LSEEHSGLRRFALLQEQCRHFGCIAVAHLHLDAGFPDELFNQGLDERFASPGVNQQVIVRFWVCRDSLNRTLFHRVHGGLRSAFGGSSLTAHEGKSTQGEEGRDSSEYRTQQRFSLRDETADATEHRTPN